ncbi:MAG: Uncharacterized protein DUF983 associated with cytochrome c oxidase?, partial [uncultured Microvirga sp.]
AGGPRPALSLPDRHGRPLPALRGRRFVQRLSRGPAWLRGLRPRLRLCGCGRRPGLLHHVHRRHPGGRPRALGRVHLRAADLAASRDLVLAHRRAQPRAGAPGQGADDRPSVFPSRRGRTHPPL